MTVQCPRCRTQYKIPSARINDPRPVFKCTRCSLVFSSEPERAARGGKAKDDKNLTLPFSSRKEPARAKSAAAEVDEDAPTIRSIRDAEPDDDSELLEDEETEEAEAGDDEAEESNGDEDDEESAGDDEEEAEDEEEPEEEEPVKPARRPRRSRSADEDDAAEPAFARAERERAAERERIAAEKERAAAEKERARIAAEKERLAAEKERERQRLAAEREKERARAEKERARAAEARRREREALRFRDEDDDEEIPDEGPDDLGEDDDEPKRPVLSASESKQRRAPINPRRGVRSAAAATPSRSPLKTVTIGVATVVIAYVAAAVWLGSSSEAAIATLSQVPVLGRLLGGDHLLVWRLQLADVDGGLDQIKGGRPAYVVSGRAVNTSNEDLRVIEIEGRLLVNGVEQRRQTVYAANQQRKTIQDLSPSEVEMLLRLEPNRRFSIRPGESASFLLVFPNPPPGTTEVTCRVVDARNS